jgi:hypothetical protein
MLDRMQHLHLYSGFRRKEPSYYDLLVNNLWPALEADDKFAITFAAVKEVENCSLLGIHLRKSISTGIPVLPNLRTVSLGGYDNAIWTSPHAPDLEQRTIDCYQADNAKGIPQILLSLPSVEHLCQSVEIGPLALSAVIYKPLTPLKVFTYHVRYPSHVCICGQEVTPIVLGAINRYYFVNAFCANVDNVKVWSRSRHERDMLIGALVQSLQLRKSIVLTPNMGESERDSLDEYSLKDTIIELYDYIRFVKPVKDDDDPFTVKRGYTARACRPAQPLDDIQKELDRALPQRWKGKVILKHREEAPPCTACGLNLMEEWKDKMKTSRRKARYESLMCAACDVYP